MDRAERFSRWRAAAAFLVGLTIPLSVSVSEIVTALAMVLVLLEPPPREAWHRIARNQVVWACLGLFLLLGIGVLYSAAPWGLALSIWLKYRKLVYLPLLLLLCRDRRASRAGLMGLLSAVAIIMLVGVAILGVTTVWPQTHLPRYTAIGSYIIQGVWVAEAAYFMAVEAISAPRWRRYWSAASVLAVAYVLYVNIGRTGFVVAGALALLLLVQALPRRWILPGMAAIVLLGASAFLTPQLGSRMSGVMAAMQGTEVDSGSFSAGARLSFYHGSLLAIARHPIVGTGTGSFVSAYNEASPATRVPTTNPHNEYLLAGVQLGVVGVAALLALLAALWFGASRLPRMDAWRARCVTVALALSCLFNSSLLDHADGHSFIFQIALFYFGASGREDQRHRHDV